MRAARSRRQARSPRIAVSVVSVSRAGLALFGIIYRERSRSLGDASGLGSFVYQTRIQDGSAISMKYP